MSTRKIKFIVFSILCIIAGIILMLLINHGDDQQTKNYTDVGGEKLGTGVPCNILNTSGKIVKYNEDSFYYISKMSPRPGIYKETIDGNVSTLIVPEAASHLNIYRSDGDLDWLYYINDKNTLCRIREDGTHREELVFLCNYLLIVDRILYYLTDGGNMWGVVINDVPQIAENAFLCTSNCEGKFVYNNLFLYYESKQEHSNKTHLVGQGVEYIQSKSFFVLLDHTPRAWWIGPRMYYMEDGSLKSKGYFSTGFSYPVNLAGIDSDSLVYPYKDYLYYEGTKDDSKDTYLFYRVNTKKKDHDKAIEIDHIPSELYLFDKMLFQYDTEKCVLHKIYEIK